MLRAHTENDQKKSRMRTKKAQTPLLPPSATAAARKNRRHLIETQRMQNGLNQY